MSATIQHSRDRKGAISREARVRRWLRSPVFLLALTAGLSAFVIQSGELGTADTTVRLQTATWLWTDEPQVPANEFPEFVIHGRGGTAL